MADFLLGARSASTSSFFDRARSAGAGLLDTIEAAVRERDRARAAERHYQRHYHSGCGREETRSEAAASTYEQFYRR